MAHFAKVVDSIVVRVIKAEQEFMDSFIDDSPGAWIQTSYNTTGGVHVDPETRQPDDGIPLRYNYAGVGFTYDRQRDAFIPPKPYNTWVLNEDTCLWEPPVPRPTDTDTDYEYNDTTQTWDVKE